MATEHWEQRILNSVTSAAQGDRRRLLDLAELDVVETYGWFDRRPYEGGEDSIWACRRRG